MVLWVPQRWSIISELDVRVLLLVCFLHPKVVCIPINDAVFLLGHLFPFFLGLFRFTKRVSLVFQDVYVNSVSQLIGACAL